MKSKFLSALLSLAVAFGMWLFVVTVISPESEKTYFDIPVVMQNEESLKDLGLIVVSDTPRVTLSLKSDRPTLNILNESNINVIIDLADVKTPGTHTLTYTISYPGNVSSRSVSVLSSSTNRITLKVEEYEEKPVPLVVDAKNTHSPASYKVALEQATFTTHQNNQTVHVEKVKVSGPQSVVAQIQQAVIDVDLTDQKKTFSQTGGYTLCDKDGKAVPIADKKIETDIDVITVQLKVQKEKTIPLTWVSYYGNGATEANVNVTLNPATVTIIGEPEAVDNITTISLGTLDFSKPLEQLPTSVNIKAQLSDVEITEGKLDVEIKAELKGLVEKKISVQVKETNLSQEYDMKPVAELRDVWVRIPAEYAGALQDGDLIAQVDCTNVSAAGEYKLLATIVCDKYPGVVQMADCPVTVTINKVG